MGKKKEKKKVDTKIYPTNVEARAKEAMAIQPPDVNEFKQDNEDTIDKWLRYRPKYKQKFETIKQKARLKND